MEFLRTIRRRSFLSEAAYVGLNVALAVAVLIVIQTTSSPFPAFALVALSKWRVFAVRPRYWLANIQANLVDFIVSIGVVILLFSANGNTEIGLYLQIALTLLYIGWLIFLKPRSTKQAMVVQAAVALFIGVTALFVVSYAWPGAVVVLAMAVIGYVTARHILTQYEEDHLQFVSLIWGLVLAQIGWVAYHWTIAYPIPFLDVRMPQVSIIAMAAGFIGFKLYDSYRRHGVIRTADVGLPVIFSVSIVLLLIFIFNGVGTGSI